MRSVELYTGAGGLALGISRAGFRHLAVVERDPNSCKTLEETKGVALSKFITGPFSIAMSNPSILTPFQKA